MADEWVRDECPRMATSMSSVLQLAEFLGASWLLWLLSARLYRPRTPRDARGVHRWPVESAEPAGPGDRPVNVRGEE